jgi:hypothetical protein
MNPGDLAALVREFGPNAARRAMGLPGVFGGRMPTSIAWTEQGITRIVDADELDAYREAVEVLEDASWMASAFEQLYEKIDIHDAALEAVEVLEDMYAQRDAETERWYERWISEHEDHGKTRGALREAEAKIKNLHIENDYHRGHVGRLRQRIKTYRHALEIIAKTEKGSLAFHVLNSEIHDGGSDF